MTLTGMGACSCELGDIAGRRDIVAKHYVSDRSESAMPQKFKRNKATCIHDSYQATQYHVYCVNIPISIQFPAATIQQWSF